MTEQQTKEFTIRDSFFSHDVSLIRLINELGIRSENSEISLTASYKPFDYLGLKSDSFDIQLPQRNYYPSHLIFKGQFFGSPYHLTISNLVKNKKEIRSSEEEVWASRIYLGRRYDEVGLEKGGHIPIKQSHFYTVEIFWTEVNAKIKAEDKIAENLETMIKEAVIHSTSYHRY